MAGLNLINPALVGGQIIGGLTGGGVSDGTSLRLPAQGGRTISVDPAGRQAVISNRSGINGTPAQAVKVKPAATPAFQQLLDIGADLCAALTAAGTKKIIELGEVVYFLDVSASALVVAKILCIPPGGGPPFDFASITRLKTSGDGWPVSSWAGGKWTFIGLADCSALALKINAVQFDEF